jgi:hypothetical protein
MSPDLLSVGEERPVMWYFEYLTGCMHRPISIALLYLGQIGSNWGMTLFGFLFMRSRKL